MFGGNKSLRKAGQVVDYNQEMINEIIKCSEDIIYFAEKYFYIVHPDKGKIKIPLYEWQKKVLKAYVEPPEGKSHIIVRIPRQQGKCCESQTNIKIRNKKTGQIVEISFEDFFNMIKKQSNI